MKLMERIIKIVKVYVYGNDDSLWDKGVEIGLSYEATKMFSHTCDEFELTLELDEKTGISKVIEIDGRKVE